MTVLTLNSERYPDFLLNVSITSGVLSLTGEKRKSMFQRNVCLCDNKVFKTASIQ